jgi:hypothetical protein
MTTAGVTSTGTMNYHLKVLGDLIAKNAASQYVLTEKGRAAVQLLRQFPEPSADAAVKKKYWKRFWIVAVALQFVILAILLGLYFSGLMTLPYIIRGASSIPISIVFLYFYYRMIRPPKPQNGNAGVNRTIRDLQLHGATSDQVKAEVHAWANERHIEVEGEREDFIRGRMGIPSGLGWTAPKYFEITYRQDGDGVAVHTEGWISVFDVSEKSFTNSILSKANIPRRQGWKAITNLWERLETISRPAEAAK